MTPRIRWLYRVSLLAPRNPAPCRSVVPPPSIRSLIPCRSGVSSPRSVTMGSTIMASSRPTAPFSRSCCSKAAHGNSCSASSPSLCSAG